MPDIKVYDIDKDNKINFNLQKFEELEGILLLSQWVIKLLLENPEHPLSPEGAVGLHKMVGRLNINEDTKLQINDKINRVEQFIINRQGQKDFNDRETLEELKILEINLNPDNKKVTTIEVDLKVKNINGDESRVRLPVGEN